MLPTKLCIMKMVTSWTIFDSGPTQWLWALFSGSKIWSLIYGHQAETQFIFWVKRLRQGVANRWSGCHLFIAEKYGDRTGCYLSHTLMIKWKAKCLRYCFHLNSSIREYCLSKFVTHFLVFGIKCASKPCFTFLRCSAAFWILVKGI